MSQARSGVLIDLDGTLVDSVYLHVIAWQEALQRHGHTVPTADVHSAVGMGSDRLVPWLVGGTVPDAEAVSSEHTARFLELVDRARETRGATALLEDLRRRGVAHVVASSASGEESTALIEALGTEPPVIDSEAVSASKPAPDLLLAGCEQLEIAPERAVLVGDSPWDAEAAQRVGIGMIGVRTGGFSDELLFRHGARDVVPDPRALIGRL
ncbi:HAD family hydrolase [Egibacter rhizosphaerae]|uniref:HAD family hydrolase n=1 Tax=Egibacter rhizosphaerae TaxID=1670831 RepID=A0A411YAZ0_9ACTN|nr:HAD family hydrolase [Egibacter rhizosphaerae]QBI18374.1 HAD family hydrolase [Egibacter rhizosphaerae]